MDPRSRSAAPTGAVPSTAASACPRRRPSARRGLLRVRPPRCRGHRAQRPAPQRLRRGDDGHVEKWSVFSHRDQSCEGAEGRGAEAKRSRHVPRVSSQSLRRVIPSRASASERRRGISTEHRAPPNAPTIARPRSETRPRRAEPAACLPPSGGSRRRRVGVSAPDGGLGGHPPPAPRAPPSREGALPEPLLRPPRSPARPPRPRPSPGRRRRRRGRRGRSREPPARSCPTGGRAPTPRRGTGPWA